MITNPIELTIELRSANGSSAEFYQAEEDQIQETLRLLAAPRLFAQPHLLVSSKECGSMIPCRGIDMILARTSAPTPLKFPLSLPVGLFDFVEQSELRPAQSAGLKEQTQEESGTSRRRSSQVQIHTLGGWSVTLKARAMIRGSLQDERHLFSHLPTLPTIPFRLAEGGFGVINTANITRASAWPKPEQLPGSAMPLALRRWTTSRSRRTSAADLTESSQP